MPSRKVSVGKNSTQPSAAQEPVVSPTPESTLSSQPIETLPHLDKSKSMVPTSQKRQTALVYRQKFSIKRPGVDVRRLFGGIHRKVGKNVSQYRDNKISSVALLPLAIGVIGVLLFWNYASNPAPTHVLPTVSIARIRTETVATAQVVNPYVPSPQVSPQPVIPSTSTPPPTITFTPVPTQTNTPTAIPMPFWISVRPVWPNRDTMMRTGISWTKVVDWGAACPVEWYFGYKVILENGAQYVCADRATTAKCTDNVCVILVFTQVKINQKPIPGRVESTNKVQSVYGTESAK